MSKDSLDPKFVRLLYNAVPTQDRLDIDMRVFLACLCSEIEQRRPANTIGFRLRIIQRSCTMIC